MRCFLQLVSDFTVFDTKSHVFTDLLWATFFFHFPFFFFTSVSSICFFLAVTRAVCVCMDRCVRCWQLLISDCKVLIMRAADLFLNSSTFKSLLRGEIKHKQLYIASYSAFITAILLGGGVANTKMILCLLKMCNVSLLF